MSLNLKHIKCPAGDGCSAFKCVFNHPREAGRDEENQSTLQATAPSGTKRSLHDVEPSSSDHEQLPKRVRKDQVSNISATNKKLGNSSDDGNVGESRARRMSLFFIYTGHNATFCADTHGRHEAVGRVGQDQSKKSSSRMKHYSTDVAAVVAATATSAVAVDTPVAVVRKPKLTAKRDAAPDAAASVPASGVPKPKQARAETLNPRLLIKSPARHETRLALLKALHHEYTRLNSELRAKARPEDLNLLLSETELVTKALDDEQEVATHKSAVYSNVMKNRVMQHKRMDVAGWKAERDEDANSALCSDPNADDSAKIRTSLTPKEDVKMLDYLLTPVEKLAGHGYVPEVPSEGDVEEVRAGIQAAGGWEKCDRCSQRFQVFPGRREDDGALTTGGACKFHWGKRYSPPKAAGDSSRPRRRLMCCDEEVGESAGCSTHDHHVFKVVGAKRLAALFNFVETPPNHLAPVDRAVCFDCEMGYTVYGMELLRLTATSWPDREVLLDILVQPLGEVLDLNSRYSGVWPDDLALAELWTDQGIPPVPVKGEDGKKRLKKVSSPAAARSLLFSLISPSTVLIGHGLENDLNALRIVHHAIVDTVLLYPHPAGLPYRYALKTLMEEHLDRKIQVESGPKTLGHDSAEDARAAGDLVRLRFKHEWERMKNEGWMDPSSDGDAVKVLASEDGLSRSEALNKEGLLTAKFIEE